MMTEDERIKKVYDQMKQTRDENDIDLRCNQIVRQELLIWYLVAVIVFGVFTAIGLPFTGTDAILSFITIPLMLYFVTRRVFRQGHLQGAAWSVAQYSMDLVEETGYVPFDVDYDEWDDDEEGAGDDPDDEQFRCIHCQQRLGSRGPKCPSCGKDPSVLGPPILRLTDAGHTESPAAPPDQCGTGCSSGSADTGSVNSGDSQTT